MRSPARDRIMQDLREVAMANDLRRRVEALEKAVENDSTVALAAMFTDIRYHLAALEARIARMEKRDKEP